MTKLFLTSCVRQPAFPFSSSLQHCRGQLRTKWLSVIVKGKLANSFFLVNVRAEIQQTFHWAWSRKYLRDMWFQSMSAAKAKMEHILSDSSLYQLTAMETASVRVCVCQKLKGHDNPWPRIPTHANAATHAYACTRSQKHTSVTYLYVKLSVRKLEKGTQSSCSTHTQTHTHAHTQRTAFYRLGSHSNSSR